MRRDPDDDMTDFLAIKARFTLHIMPQTPRGWRAFFWWLGAILLPALSFVAFAFILAPTPHRIWIGYAVWPMLALTGLLAWLMLRWMLRRSVIMSPDEIRTLSRDERSRER